MMAMKASVKAALKALATSRPEDAAQACVSVLKSKEGRDHPDALVYLGKAHFLLKDADKALKAYRWV